MTKGKTIDHLIADARIAVSKFQRVCDWSAAGHWQNRLDSLEQAKACRLTEAETAVIEAALDMTGPCSPRLALARAELRKERAHDSASLALAERVINDGYLADVCPDCGSEPK